MPNYNGKHRRDRAWWVPHVATGTIPCGYCRQPITGDWDLGHPEDGDTGPSTPWHRTCNRQHGARKGNAARVEPRTLHWH